MKIAALLLSLIFLTSFQSAPLVKVIGFYSNEKSKDGEHSYGYTLKLWKYNGKIIGTVAFNESLIGDRSEELIKDVNFNEKTGGLSFSSSLLA